MVAGGMGKYAGLSASEQSFAQLMDKMPKLMLALFGMNDVNIYEASGYYAILFVFLYIMASLHAAILGARIISKEEQDKTSEFLFVKPVSRARIITFKLLASLTYVAVINAVSLTISIVMAAGIVKGEDVTRDLFVLSLGLLMLQLIFLFSGAAFGSISKKPSASAGQSAIIVLASYILSVITGLSDQFDFVKYITPFKYFEPKSLINGGSFDSLFIVISILIIGVMIGASYTFFPKRDLVI